MTTGRINQVSREKLEFAARICSNPGSALIVLTLALTTFSPLLRQAGLRLVKATPTFFNSTTAASQTTTLPVRLPLLVQ